MEQDSIKLLSNIMLKSRVKKDKDGYLSYLPFDLLPDEYGDVRNDNFLSEYQRNQKLKRMFAAKRIIDEDEEDKKEDISEKKDTSVSSNKTADTNHITDNALAGNPSYDLNENVIPVELRERAIDLPVKGAVTGWFYLVPYTGSVKNYTNKQTETLYVLLMRKGQERKIGVSVVTEDRIIYIREELYELYEQGLSNPDGIELVSSLGT